MAIGGKWVKKTRNWDEKNVKRLDISEIECIM